MAPSPFTSLRSRLLLLVVLCVMPALALILHAASDQRRAAAAAVHDRALQVARLTAEGQDNFIEGARQLLVALAELPVVRVGDTVACGELFRELLARYPNYANLGVASRDGTVTCSGIPTTEAVSVADRAYLRRAFQTHGFAVGEWQVGRLTGKPTLNFAHVVKDAAGRESGVVFAALDVAWLEESMATAMLPEGGELLLYDATDNLVVRLPAGPRHGGRQVPAGLRRPGLRAGHAIVETEGADGQGRIYGIVPLRASDGQLHVAVGLSTEAAFAEANRLLRRQLLWLALVAALAVVAAWAGGDLFVLRPLRRLLGAAERLRAGDLGARVGRPPGGGEIGELARAFDDMADSLEFRQAERDRAREQIVRDAFHDRLTGLPNRALFLDRLSRSMERVRRGDRFAFAVLALDLDRFKVINDSLGHLTGDELLVAVGRRLAECVRPGDTVARLGGDEFAVLLEDIRDPSLATRLAETVETALSAPFSVAGHEVFTTVSIGIVASSGEQDKPEHYLRDADTAMYRAKARGGGRHELFDPGMHASAVELLKLETDLRRALERREFRMEYQPIVSLKTGRIIGCEALMRWHHSERSVLLPGEFIPLAEETGLIGVIGEWALRTACEQNRQWQARGLPPVSVAVNLSAYQFRQRDLAGLVSRVLDETGLAPTYLELELTESCIMDNAEETIGTLRALQQIGMQLSVDDFGTGYSSLRYLRRFPIHTLKIDQYFVRGIGGHSDDASIATAIIALGHGLNLSVIAEGVETRQQLDFLRAHGCDAMQGRLFSPPVPPEEFARLLATGAILPGTEPARRRTSA